MHEGFTPTVKTSASVITVAREREKMDRLLSFSSLDFKLKRQAKGVQYVLVALYERGTELYNRFVGLLVQKAPGDTGK